MLHLILSLLYVLESKSFQTPTTHKVCKLFKFLEVLHCVDIVLFTCYIYMLTDQLAEKKSPWIKHSLVAEPSVSTTNTNAHPADMVQSEFIILPSS